jgi:hypothetical protein
MEPEGSLPRSQELSTCIIDTITTFISNGSTALCWALAVFSVALSYS